MDFYTRIAVIDAAIQEWFLMHKNISEAKPSDVTDYLIEKEIYSHDNKEGRPLRDDLRELKKRNQLHLIRGLVADERNKNTLWYFTPVR